MPDSTQRFREGGDWEESAGYSRAVRRFGHIAVSGTTATGADTYHQARSAMERALAAIRELGGAADDVVRSRVYLTPEADWEQAARAHQELLGAVAPANTMLRVAGLIGDDFLVEIELEAELSPEPAQ